MIFCKSYLVVKVIFINVVFLQVVGVAQIINKNPGGVPFTKEDEKVYFAVDVVTL